MYMDTRCEGPIQNEDTCGSCNQFPEYINWNLWRSTTLIPNHADVIASTYNLLAVQLSELAQTCSFTQRRYLRSSSSFRTPCEKVEGVMQQKCKRVSVMIWYVASHSQLSKFQFDKKFSSGRITYAIYWTGANNWPAAYLSSEKKSIWKKRVKKHE